MILDPASLAAKRVALTAFLGLDDPTMSLKVSQFWAP